MTIKRGPRTSAKALIESNGRYLFNAYTDKEGIWYNLPGGGQDHGEELSNTVVRECNEEIGAKVKVLSLQFIREFIAAEIETDSEIAGLHQVEFIFRCELCDPEYSVAMGDEPDINQHGVEWLTLDQMRELRCYPRELVKYLPLSSDKPIYLGAVD